MFSNDDDGQLGLVLGLVFGLVALVVCLVTGVAIQQSNASTAAPRAAVATPRESPKTEAPPDTSGQAQAASDTAGIKVDYGVARFYFSPGKSVLAAGAADVLADLVKGAQGGRKLVISGFHDTSGDPLKNAALASERAIAVRDALYRAGASSEQVELRKPEDIGSGKDAEARRVEVTVQ